MIKSSPAPSTPSVTAVADHAASQPLSARALQVEMADHLHAPSGADPAEASAPMSPAIPAPGPKPSKPRSRKWTEEALAERRKLRRQIKQQVKASVDQWMQRAEQSQFTVNYLVVQATGHLTAAAALQVISVASEQQLTATGDPYTYRTQEQWCESSGLSAEEWMTARHALRQRGFVLERRRWDLDLDEIVIDLAFDFDAWAERLAEIRQQAVDFFQFEHERDAGLLKPRLVT